MLPGRPHASGDGGVVGSSDERFGPVLQKYGDKGFDRIKGGGFQAFSTNYRMSEPQAAVAAAQLTRLEAIAGAVPSLINPPPGCRFAPRCKFAQPKCTEAVPELRTVEAGHKVACVLY